MAPIDKQIFKIQDLIYMAMKAAETPLKAKTDSGSIPMASLISKTCLIPFIIMLVNRNHYHTYGEELIHVTGGILVKKKYPFSTFIKGDLDSTKMSEPVGYVLMQLTYAMKSLNPVLNGDGELGGLSETIRTLDEIKSLEDDKVIGIETYSKFDLSRYV